MTASAIFYISFLNKKKSKEEPRSMGLRYTSMKMVLSVNGKVAYYFYVEYIKSQQLSHVCYLINNLIKQKQQICK